MKEMPIKKIEGIQVFDSRGNPTVQVEVTLEDGTKGKAIIPSGASTGSFEAIELRDGDLQEYNGMGVKKAIDNINKKIAKALIGENSLNQSNIDKKMIELDGTENKSKLGANAILGISLANARASARSLNEPLYRYIGGISGNTIPVPMMNILNGGKHSDNNLSIQEFMIVPVGAENFQECMEMCTETYHVLKDILKQKGMSTAVGDEGGFAPTLESSKEKNLKIADKSKKYADTTDEEAIELILNAIEKAGFKPKKDIELALDFAATEMREAAKKIEKEGYYFWKTDEYKSKGQMIDFIEELTEKYPIMSIEDGLAENDWKEWKELTKRIGKSTQLVGDDLFVTNSQRLEYGIKENIANTILIKPNQIGTLTETLETIKLAKRNGYRTIISHRSGDTEDSFIADLAVAVNAGQIKSGAPCRTERVSKYNRLLNIEKDFMK